MIPKMHKDKVRVPVVPFHYSFDKSSSDCAALYLQKPSKLTVASVPLLRVYRLQCFNNLSHSMWPVHL